MCTHFSSPISYFLIWGFTLDVEIALFPFFAFVVASLSLQQLLLSLPSLSKDEILARSVSLPVFGHFHSFTHSFIQSVCAECLTCALPHGEDRGVRHRGSLCWSSNQNEPRKWTGLGGPCWGLVASKSGWKDSHKTDPSDLSTALPHGRAARDSPGAHTAENPGHLLGSGV